MIRILTFICVLLTMACAKPLPNPDELVVAIEEFPNQLDPRYAQGAYNTKISKLIFNGLLKYDANFNLVPDLAKQVIQISPTEIQVILKDNILFHHGKKLEAQDVIFTFASIKNTKQVSPYTVELQRMQKMAAVSPLEIKITLKEPYTPFLGNLTLGIVPSDLASTADFSQKKLSGTGPFQFVDSKLDRYLLLKRFDHYFLGSAKIAGLRIRTIKDDTTRVLEFIHGNIDLIQNAIPFNWLPWLGKNYPDLKKMNGPSANYQYLGFNLQDPILANLKVRWAIAYLLDLSTLIDFKLKGYGRAAKSLIPPEHWAFAVGVSSYHHDLAKAKHLLDDAGYPQISPEQPRFKLLYKTSTNPQSMDIALAIKEQFKHAGIELEVRPYDWGIFYKDIRSGNFQMFSLSWVGVADPSLLVQAFASDKVPPEGVNRGHFKNEAFDLLAKQSLKETDKNILKNIYAQMQNIVQEQLPYVGLWYPDNVVIMQKNVHGYYLMPNASFEGLVSVYKN